VEVHDYALSKGLINVVLRHVAGDDVGKYSLGDFAINMYVNLLQ